MKNICSYIYLNTVCCCCGCIIYIPGHKKDTDSVWLTCIFAWFPHALCCCCLLKLRTPPQSLRSSTHEQCPWKRKQVLLYKCLPPVSLILWHFTAYPLYTILHCYKNCQWNFLSFISAIFCVKFCKEKLCQFFLVFK